MMGKKILGCLMALLICLLPLGALAQTTLAPQPIDAAARAAILEELQAQLALRSLQIAGSGRGLLRDTSGLRARGAGSGRGLLREAAVPIEETAEYQLALAQMSKEFYAGYEESLAQATPADIVLLSLSPDGKKILAAAGGVYFAYTPGSGEVSLILPDFSRMPVKQLTGLDEYRRFFMALPLSMTEPSSFAWSPDGRYVALTAWKQLMMNMRPFDLYLLDTQEGAAYTPVAFDNGKGMMQGMAGVYQACFSPDGDTLYYAVYGNKAREDLTEVRATLWAYDMAQGGEPTYLAPAVFGERGFGDLRDLEVLPDGRLLQMLDQLNMNDPQGFLAYTPKGADELWKMEISPLPSRGDTLNLYANRVAASDRTGYGILSFTDGQAFSVFNAQEGFAGAGDLLVIRGFDQQEPEVVSIYGMRSGKSENPASKAVQAAYPAGMFNLTKPLTQEQTAAIEEAEKANEEAEEGEEVEVPEFTREPLWVVENPAMVLTAAALSPDGTQALLLMYNRTEHTWGFLCMDLATLALTPVAFDQELELLPMPQIGLSWGENGQVMLQTMKGGTLFTLEQ